MHSISNNIKEKNDNICFMLAQIYKKHKMTSRSDRIFSVSELRLHGMLEATILYAAAADGTIIPPFVIFRGNADYGVFCYCSLVREVSFSVSSFFFALLFFNIKKIYILCFCIDWGHKVTGMS